MAVAEDGEKALAILRKEGGHAGATRPDLILLDLGLPGKNGREVLAEIKADPDLKNIPVVILTVSRSEEDILRSYQLQASNYLTKPIGPGGLKLVVEAIQQYLRAVARIKAGRY